MDPRLEAVANVLRKEGATAAGVDTDTLAARLVAAVDNTPVVPLDDDDQPSY
jgi:hypothetical protein